MGWSDLCSRCTDITRASLIPTNAPEGVLTGIKNRYFIGSHRTLDSVETAREDKLRDWIANNGFESQLKPVKLQEPARVLFYFVEELLQSARDGCHLCSLMAGACDMDIDKTHDILDTATVLVPMWFEDKILNGSFPDRTKISLALYQVFAVANDADEWQVHSKREGRLSVFKATNPALPCSYTDPSSSESGKHLVQRIRTWIDECHRGDHPACHALRKGMTEAAERPQRLIQIWREGDALGIRLVRTARIVAEGLAMTYAVVSWCWGMKEVACKLVERNLSDYQSSIEWSMLPRTFKDAVIFAWSLGLRYIWIDALCIVQDNEDDWLYEAPRMAQIYANAVVCFAATSRNGPDEGLYTQDLTWAPLICDSSRVQISRTTDENLERQKTEALNTRAWTFQEQQLAVCTVRFARDQLYWTCPTESHAEYRGEEPSFHAKIREGSILSEMIHVPEDFLLHDSTWEKLVTEYASRQSSKKADRLVAMSGVAQAYIRLRKDQKTADKDRWIAGLLRNNRKLPGQLVWRETFLPKSGSIAGHNPIISQPSSSLDAKAPYTAPTWSWASVHSAIEFTRSLSRRPHYEMTLSSRFRILNVCVETRTKDPYGPVVSGELVVAGLLHQVSLTEDLEHSFEGSNLHWNEAKKVVLGPGTLCICGSILKASCNAECQDGAEHWFWASIDSRVPATRLANINFFLPVFEQRSLFGRDLTIITGLLLARESSDRGTYKRAGLLTVQRSLKANDGIVEEDLMQRIWTTSTTNLPREHYLEISKIDGYLIRII